MNTAIQQITAFAQKTSGLMHRERENSRWRISRAGTLINAGQSKMDRTKQMLDATTAILDKTRVIIHHSTNSNSSGSEAGYSAAVAPSIGTS
jgi:hypothetical protein